MKNKFLLFTLILQSLAFIGVGDVNSDIKPGASQSPWLFLEPGLELGTFQSPQKSIAGDSLIRILRINPEKFEIKLYNSSSAKESRRYSAKSWALNNGMVASINASMYQADRVTSVALMKTKNHINNPRVSKDKAILAFDPKEESMEKVQILDRDCQDFNRLRNKYASLVQSIRMISCKGKNVWKQQNRMWSIAAIGMDKQKNIFFIHSRSPYSMHDFIDILLELPINIDRALYTEGGAEAQMFIKSGKNLFDFVGSFSTGSNETDNNFIGWPIPNVIGIVRKPEP